MEERRQFDMGDLVTVKIEGIRTHITSIDVTLDKLSTSFEALVRLEEKYLAHVKEDDLIHASVKTDSQRLTLLELQVGPLIEMRRWIIAGAVGVISLVAVNVFNAYNTFMGTSELQKHTAQGVSAARALPEAAAVVEDQRTMRNK
jgi:hypothetical protein